MSSKESKTSHEAISSTPPVQLPLPKGAINLLSGIRTSTGVAILLAPIPMCKLFGIPLVGSAIPLARLVGIRDVAIGGILYTADDGSDSSRREVKRALVAGAASDAVDVGIAVTAVALGHFSRMGGGLFGTAAATCLGLGLYSLRNVPSITPKVAEKNRK